MLKTRCRESMSGRWVKILGVLYLLATACSSEQAVPDENTGSGGYGDVDGDSDGDSDSDAVPPFFSKETIWYKDRTGETPHVDSSAVISWMAESGNSFGSDGEFLIDLGIKVLHANNEVLLRIFDPRPDAFWESECDLGHLPVPEGGSIEGAVDYSCPGDEDDCHLLVVSKQYDLLFEAWRADISGGVYNAGDFVSGCMAVWDLKRDYGWNVVTGLDYDHMGRGRGCTSADAAGFPIAPLLFTPEELAGKEVGHALRFTLPNRNIRAKKYVAPATHVTPAVTGPDTAPPYGAQLRLKPDAQLVAAHLDVNLNKLPVGARAIITALQKYGMFLSDGGTIALTGQSDLHSDTKYCDHDRFNYCDEDPDRLLHEHDLKFLKITDFEMLDNGGPLYDSDADCSLLYRLDDETHKITER